MMTIKFNSEECSYDTPLSPELLSKSKDGTLLSNNPAVSRIILTMSCTHMNSIMV